MRPESRFFTVFPSVVRAGETTEITITAIHEKIRFKENEYLLRVIPKENLDISRKESDRSNMGRV